MLNFPKLIDFVDAVIVVVDVGSVFMMITESTPILKFSRLENLNFKVKYQMMYTVLK